MNSVKLQVKRLIYRNLLLFYTPTVNSPKEKVKKKNPIYNHIKKNKISRNKLNQGSDRPIL